MSILPKDEGTAQPIDVRERRDGRRGQTGAGDGGLCVARELIEDRLLPVLLSFLIPTLPKK
jgi:hypothetical protein